jgi:hypothetical protein
MYCPRCSHQAASNNVRFCPGCGFRMEGVAELLANDGFFTQGAETAPKPRRSMVKRGALLGVTLMLIGGLLVMLPNLGPGPDGENAVAAFFFFGVALISLISMSGYLKRLITRVFNIFSEEEPSPSKKIAYALPATHSAPGADSVLQAVDTAKASQPASVTEQTTSRLNNA